MSDILTEIRLFNKDGWPIDGGVADYGRLTKEQMLKQIRDYHRHNQQIAEIVLAAGDDEFDIEVVRGAIVRRHVEWVQRSINRKHEPEKEI